MIFVFINISLTGALISSEVLLYQEENLEEDVALSKYLVTILQCAVNENRNFVNHYHWDIQFNTALYELEFDDSEIHLYANNVIADSIHRKVDQFGRRD